MDPVSLLILALLVAGVVWLIVRRSRASEARRAEPPHPPTSEASSLKNVRLDARAEADGALAGQGRELFELCGLSWVFYGERTADEIFTALVGRAKVFETTRPVGNGLGRFGTLDGQVWSAGEGSRGSYIAIHGFPDADSGWMLNEIVMPTNELSSEIKRSMAMLGEAPPEFAGLYAASRAKPVWELSGLSHLAPATFDGSLREQLLSEGWQEVAPDVDMFRTTAPGAAEGRTQLLFVAMLRAGVYGLYSPILEVSDLGGEELEIPTFLQEEDFSSYTLVPFGGRVYLESVLSRGEAPGMEQIYSRAIELARFADECEARYSSEDLM